MLVLNGAFHIVTAPVDVLINVPVPAIMLVTCVLVKLAACILPVRYKSPNPAIVPPATIFPEILKLPVPELETLIVPDPDWKLAFVFGNTRLTPQIIRTAPSAPL